jgi:serine/threonine protein phosphatase PrpC
MRSVLLRGREHLDLGAVDVVGEGAAAAAISLGGAPKPYAHTDPNEDAVLFATGRAGTLLAVADGHHGFEAAEVALELLLAGPAPHWVEPGGIAPEDWPRHALAVFSDANAEILRETLKGDWGHPRTTLAFALALPGEGVLLWAAIGDSHVFRAGPKDVEDLGVREAHDDRVFFLGFGEENADSLARKCVIGSAPLGDTRAVVLASDGLSEQDIGLTHPERAVEEVLDAVRGAAPDRRALEAARLLLEEAVASHRRNAAGDNVATALLWLGDVGV